MNYATGNIIKVQYAVHRVPVLAKSNKVGV